MLDNIVGYNLAKVDELVQTALLVDQAANDKSIIENVLKEASQKIDDGFYQEALTLLQDMWTYE